MNVTYANGSSPKVASCHSRLIKFLDWRESLQEFLAQKSASTRLRLPRHLLINRTPLREEESVVTLQSLGSGAFCTYQILDARAFIESLSAHGYELVDRWDNPDFPVGIFSIHNNPCARCPAFT